MPEASFQLSRRRCAECQGTGRDPRYTVEAWEQWAAMWGRHGINVREARAIVSVPCLRCGAAGEFAPFLHFDAVVNEFGNWESDGCNMQHMFVLDPCAACLKAPLDFRHQCRQLENEKACTHSPGHHLHAPGVATGAETREGCPEHGVDRDFVYSWWARASERELRLAPCFCCLAPMPERSLHCKRCAPAQSVAVAA